MAFSMCRILLDHGGVIQDALANSFANNYDPRRGYGAAMLHELLPALKGGSHWRIAATCLFSGEGSYGNGAAMRVAPLGAYFADDLEQVVRQSHLSAEVTHTHREGIAGAI